MTNDDQPPQRLRPYKPDKKREQCGICGRTAMIDAVDNYGNSYRGCARCRVVGGPRG